MAKIIKVAPATHAPSVANPFRTSRNSATNPFKYANFEGNTLQFADVFEGFEPKKVNKLKMIASSVTGSMNKFRTSITEPIAQFVNRVRSGISSAWEYAKNTNISDLSAVKAFNNVMNTRIEIPGISALSSSISGIKDKISGGIGSIGHNVLGIGDDINQKWAMVVSRFNSGRISSDMSVTDLERLWKSEILASAAEGSV